MSKSPRKKSKIIVRFKRKKESRSCLGPFLYLAFLGEHRGGFTILGHSRDAYRFVSREEAEKRTLPSEPYRFAIEQGYEMQTIPALPADAVA